MAKRHKKERKTLRAKLSRERSKKIVHFIQKGELDKADVQFDRLKRKLANAPEILAENLIYITGQISEQRIRTVLLKEVAIVLNNYGMSLKEAGQQDTAIEKLEQILKIYPDDIEILCVYGAALGDAELYDEAVKAFERALQTNPNNAKTLNLYGMVLGKSGQYEAALEKFEQASRFNPYSDEILTNWGIALNKLGRHDEAIEKYKQALRNKPDDPRILNFYGYTLDNTGRHEEAIGQYKEALRIRPDDVDILNNYGGSLEKIGQYEMAITQYEKALKITPDDPKILNNCGFALAQTGQYGAAITYYDKALQIKPDDVDILHNWGAALGNSGQHEASLEKYKHALKLSPNNVRLLADYGTVLGIAGQDEAALEIFEQALQLAPDNAEILGDYGAVLNNLGRYEVATEKLEQAFQMKPDDAEILCRYGTVLANTGRMSEAFEKIEQVLTIAPDKPYLLLHCALLLEWQGKVEKAIAILERIDPNILPQHHATFVYLNLGRLYHKTASETQRNKYFELAIEHSPNKDDQLIHAVRCFLAVRKATGKENIEILQQMAQHSPEYNQALKLLSLNMLGKKDSEQHFYSSFTPLELRKKYEESVRKVKRLQVELESLQDNPTIFVEGPTDQQILAKAIELFSMKLKGIKISTEDSSEGAGVNWVKDKIREWIYARKKEKAVVLLDNDKEGRDLRAFLQELEDYKRAEQKNLVKTFLLSKPEHLIEFKKIKGFLTSFTYCIEHMFPPKYWKKAEEKGWLLEEREGCTRFFPHYEGKQTLEEYLISEGTEEEYLIYIFYKFKWEHKKNFARYVCTLPQDEIREAFKNFEGLVQELEDFFDRPIL